MIYAYTGAHLALSQAPAQEDALGMLPDALEGTVRRDTDGMFELDLTYPRKGANAQALALNRWLRCPAGGRMGDQYFRIDQLWQGLDGSLQVHGVHLSYNALTILAAPFSAHDGQNYASVGFFPWYQALTQAISQVDGGQMGQFSVVGYTDDMALNAADYTQPVTLKQAVLDAVKDRGYLLDYLTFGVRIWQLPPSWTAPSFTIRYGRDMLDFSSSEDATDFYTHILPYYMVDQEMHSHNLEVYPLSNLPAELSGYRRIQAINLGDYYDGLDRELDLSTLQSVIDQWLETHPWNPLPREISVEQIPQEGNTFELGEPGRIYCTPLGLTVDATVVSLTYDVLRDRVTSIGVGSRQRDITDTIAGLVMG